MGDRHNMLADIAAAADELCDPRQNTEPIRQQRRTRRGKRATRLAWVTTQPGLLQQLAELVYPPSSDTDGPGSAPPQSRPPVFLEALSALWQIRTAAARWCWSLKIDLRATAEGDIRALVGAAPMMDSSDQALLLNEMQQWRTWAAVLTGWQSDLFKPHVPCLACGTVGTLRVNLTRRSAFCVNRECQAMWDEGTVGLLAEHIKVEMELMERRKREYAAALRKTIDTVLAGFLQPIGQDLAARTKVVEVGYALIADCPDYTTRRAVGREFADRVGMNRETVHKAIAVLVEHKKEASRDLSPVQAGR